MVLRDFLAGIKISVDISNPKNEKAPPK